MPGSPRPTTKSGKALSHALYEAEGIHADDRILNIEAEAVAAERARLREVVEGLAGACHDGEGLGCETSPCVENVSRDEVLGLLGPRCDALLSGRRCIKRTGHNLWHSYEQATQDELRSGRPTLRADRVLASLRSDPAVTAALAEALHMELGDETCAYWDNKNDWDMVEHRKQAAAIADSLLGPRESAGGMEP